MIAIQLEDKDDFLELPPDTTISLQLENPLFGTVEKLSPGSFSLPFETPGGDASPKNAAALKNPEVIENNESYQPQKATLLVSENAVDVPIPFKKGNLKTRGTKKGKTSSFFTFGLNSISEEFKTARLRDVIAEQFTIDGNSAVTKKVYIKYTGAGEPQLTVNGTTYFGFDLGHIRNLIMDDYHATLDSGKYVPFAVYHNGGPFELTESPGGLTAPFLELSLSTYYTYHDPVLEMDFWLDQPSTDPLHEFSVNTDDPLRDDYSVESFDMSDYYDGIDEFLQDYYNGPHINNKIRFPVAFNANSYDESIKDGELINGIDSEGIIRNLPNFANWKIKNRNSLQPFIMRKHIFDKIAETFGFEWEGDFYTHVDFANMLEWNTASLDVPMLYIGAVKYVFWRRVFNLNELVPDMSVVDYLKAIASKYNLGLWYNEQTKKVKVKMRENIARSIAYEDITRISSPVDGGEDVRILGHRIFLNREKTDALSYDESVTLGDGERPMEVRVGHILTTYGAFTAPAKYLTGPRVSQKHGETFGLRTFYYRGIIDMTTFTYAGADIKGEEITETLTWITNNLWKYWLLFERNRREVMITVKFPLRVLMAFDWEKKYRFDRNNYLVKSIALKVTNKRLESADVKLYTMR